MNDSYNAFTVSTNIPEEDLLALTKAVDSLGFQHLIMNGAVIEREDGRELVDYIRRATKYLDFLRDWIEKDDIERISTAPISETMIRRRISRVLRTCVEGARA